MLISIFKIVQVQHRGEKYYYHFLKQAVAFSHNPSFLLPPDNLFDLLICHGPERSHEQWCFPSSTFMVVSQRILYP